MPTEIKCPQCQAILRVPDDAGGKPVRCPACAHVFTAEATSAAGDPFAAPGGEAADVNPYQPSSVADGHNPFQDAAAPPGQLTPRTIEAFLATRPWVLFVAVLGMLGGAIYALAGLLILASSLPQPSAPPWFMGVVCWLFAGLILWLSSLLWRYGQRLGQFGATGDYVALEQAVAFQHAYWRAFGLMILISFALGMLLPCLGGIVGALAHH